MAEEAANGELELRLIMAGELEMDGWRGSQWRAGAPADNGWRAGAVADVEAKLRLMTITGTPAGWSSEPARC